MNVILSIKPKYIKEIIMGRKNYEFRKTVWKRPVSKVYIYATDPVRKIVGYFTVKKILKADPEVMWLHCQEESGITESEFFEYFNSHKLGYAIEIDRLTMFQLGRDPCKLIHGFHAPQNFMYLEQNIEV